MVLCFYISIYMMELDDAQNWLQRDPVLAECYVYGGGAFTCWYILKLGAGVHTAYYTILSTFECV